MMLRNLLRKTEQRYAIAGSVLGTLLPGVAIGTDYALHAHAGVGLFHLSAPTLAAFATLPALFGFGFHRLGQSRATLMAELTARHETERQLTRDAYHDRLTGLANRFRLERDIQAIIASGEAARPALLLLDLDRFKFINDSFGHDAGDDLLVAISERLVEALSPVLSVYRLGGDEFVVLYPGMPGEEVVADACRKICAIFDAPFTLTRSQVTSGCSIGVTFREPQDVSMSSLLKRADLALYEAKETYGSCYRFFDAALADSVAAHASIEQALALGLAGDEFFLEFQPIVGTESRRVRSFEALVRWNHPERGLLMPGAFLPAAERTGLILPLGKWVLAEACRQAATWPGPIGVAVNVVGQQFKESAFVGYVIHCLAESGLAPGRLTLEVTEAAFTVGETAMRESLRQLRSLGVRVTLDDFGAGHSSINILRSYPIDHLKIDRSVARGMLERKQDADLVDIMVQLGHAFQVATTVEGIETEDQVDFVRRLGAAEIQGYLISPPVAAENVVLFLAPDARLSA